MAVFTNCIRATRNLDERSLPFLPKKIVEMNNSAFSSRQTEWNEEDYELYEFSWRQSMRKMKEIVDFIDYLAPQSTQVFNEMLLRRNEICSEIPRAFAEIEKYQVLVDVLTKLSNERTNVESEVAIQEIKASTHDRRIQLYQSQEQLREDERRVVEYKLSDVLEKLEYMSVRAQKARSDKSACEGMLNHVREVQRQCSNYSKPVLRSYIEAQYTPYHNTMCREPSCNKTCDEACELDYTTVVGDNIFRSSRCMSGDYCKNCGHSYKWHVHATYKLNKKQVWDTEIDFAMKNKYDQQWNFIRELESNIARLDNDARVYQQELANFEDQLRTLTKIHQEYLAEKLEIRTKKLEFLVKKETVEEVVYAVRKENAAIEAKSADKDAELREAQRLLKAAQLTRKEKYEELKRICRRLNSVDELNSTKESLRLSLATLTTTEARESANAFINSLDHMVDELTELGLS